MPRRHATVEGQTGPVVIKAGHFGVEAQPSSPIPLRVHARAVAALGRDLVTDDVVAVMELVKNSYDALATQVDVRVHPEGVSDGEQAFIEVSDNGHGRDYETIITGPRNFLPENLLRIRAPPPDGGIRRDWPAELVLECPRKTPVSSDV